MKKLYIFMTLVACTMMFAGCQKDSLIFDAEIEDYSGSDSKVYIKDGYACWQHGDPVMLNGALTSVSLDRGAGQATILANVNELSNKKNFTAVYPAQEGTTCNNGTATVVYPEVQTYRQSAASTDQVVDAPMVAYVNSTSEILKFRNVGNLVAVHVPYSATIGAMTISEITITSSNSNLWGTATVNAKNDVENPSLTMNNDGGKTVRLDIPNGFGKVNAGETKTFYVYVPNITNSKLTINVSYAAVRTGVKGYFRFQTEPAPVNSTLNVTRNHQLNVTLDYNHGEELSGINVLYGEGTTTSPYIINSAANLLLLANLDVIPSGKIFSQRANITLPASFTGIGSVDHPFCGDYRGKNKTIINGSNTAIFNVLGNNAKIQNLVVENSIVASGAQTMGGLVSVINGDNVKISYCTAKGSLSVNNATTEYSVGGIVGKNTGSNLSMSDCINGMNIDCAGVLSKVGGIVGECSGDNITIGTITNNGTIKGGKIGGIVGEANTTSMTITKSINNGKLSSLQADNTYIGGILGNNMNNVLICNSVNHAALSANAKYVGGLVGNNTATLTADNSYVDGRFDADIYGFSSIKGGLIGKNTSSATFKNAYIDFINNVPLNINWIVGEGNASCEFVHRTDVGETLDVNDRTGEKHMQGVSEIGTVDALVADLILHKTRATSWKKLRGRAALDFEN